MNDYESRAACDCATVRGTRCRKPGSSWICDYDPATGTKTPRLVCGTHYERGEKSGVDTFHESAPDRREQAAKHPGYRMLYGDPMKVQAA